MPRAVVAIGSNIDPEAHVPAAVACLQDSVRVLAVSQVYETPPVGAPGTPWFLNAAVLIETDLSPNALREQVLRPIEAALGRVRTSNPNAPRPIDLDLVIYAASDARVTWYDAQVTAYAHVALPVADVVPDWRLPDREETVREVAHRLRPQAQAFRPRPDVAARLAALVRRERHAHDVDSERR